jgi:hypothetical protein
MVSGNVLVEQRAATYLAAPSWKASSSLTPSPPRRGEGAATSRTGRPCASAGESGRGPGKDLVTEYRKPDGYKEKADGHDWGAGASVLEDPADDGSDRWCTRPSSRHVGGRLLAKRDDDADRCADEEEHRAYDDKDPADKRGPICGSYEHGTPSPYAVFNSFTSASCFQVWKSGRATVAEASNGITENAARARRSAR